ncbi:MAG: hypothetical protein M4579_002628 [Chaenotheca gracillima]|nr:MAG: hypothetical protein M4579_002628 [Chaenotheca gracillima]
MPLDSIRRVVGRDGNTYTYYPTLIVGAGESGIALGCRLKQKLGTDQFRIFDRQGGIGGTWWINRYPGVACDVPAIFYSFSWAQNPDWSSFYPPGPEVAEYLIDVCAKFQILDKIELDTDVVEAQWLNDEEVWEVTLQHLRTGTGDLSQHQRRELANEKGVEHVYLEREVVRAKVFASAAGGLVEPKTWSQDLPGKDTFEGDIFHSARWDYNVDLTGKDVIVVGSGCSAAQFVGRLTKAPYNAKSVTQLMRSPPWVSPKQKPLGGEELWHSKMPFVLRYVPGVSFFFRALVWTAGEVYFLRHFGNKPGHAKARLATEAFFLDNMKRKVPEKYHEILTPDWSLGCKRLVIDLDWFPALSQPEVELDTRPLTKVHPRSVTLGPGRLYPDPKDTKSLVPTDEVEKPADVIILANGFDVGEWLHPLKIKGKDGKYLNEVWQERGGAQAYLGAAMDGFPNFFLIFGPNTATGHSSVIYASENMVEFSLQFIEPVLKGEASQVEIKKEAEIRWTKEIQAELQNTVWATGGCSNWYLNKEGWNSTTYPFSQVRFTYECLFPRWKDWDIKYTKKGSLKLRARQLIKLTAFAIAIIGIRRTRQAGYGLKDLRNLAPYVAKKSVELLSQGVNFARNSL